MDVIDIITNAGAYISFAQVATVAIGLVIGTIIGVLPGIGPLLGVTLAIPFTFHMDPVASLALLIGIYQGGSYGGAISATLLGIPGTPLAAATLLDAYPMARAGRASEAVSLATVASWIGGIIGGIILLFFAPLLAAIAIKFGPAEKLGLALLGLTAIASLSQGSTIKGLLSGALGLLLATVGVDPFTGISRFNFGFTSLTGGLTFVSLLVGLFAISEVLIQIETGVRAWDKASRVGFTVRVMKTIVTDWFGYLRGSMTGVIIGVIPGIGGVTSSFLAYKLARDFSKTPERFGKGESKGVIATESANSATTGGALIPMLALGMRGAAATYRRGLDAIFHTAVTRAAYHYDRRHRDAVHLRHLCGATANLRFVGDVGVRHRGLRHAQGGHPAVATRDRLCSGAGCRDHDAALEHDRRRRPVGLPAGAPVCADHFSARRCGACLPRPANRLYPLPWRRCACCRQPKTGGVKHGECERAVYSVG
jgi:TctA family transporter